MQPGQLRKDCSVCKKRIAEKGNKPKGKRVETTAVVQGVMVETSEYDDGMLIESRFSFVSELTTRGTTPPLSPISGPSIEQRGYKQVHWTERGLNTLVESSWLVPVRSVLGLARNGTSVAFTCSGDYGPRRQPKPLLQSSGVSLLNDFKEKRNTSGASKLASHGRGLIVCEQVGWSFPFTDFQSARGWSYVINRRGRTSYRLHKRSTRHRRSSCPLNRDSYCEQPNQINVD